MVLIRTYLAPSPIEGIGAFTAEHVKRGTSVWRFDPSTDHKFPLDDLARVPAPAAEFLEKYAYVDPDLGPLVCGDNARFFNHSETPTLRSENGEDVAVADLPPGTELTSDYRTFGIGLCRNFLDHP